MRISKSISVGLALALLMGLAPLAAMADDATPPRRGDRVVGDAQEPPVEVPKDRPSDEVTDRVIDLPPDKVTDRITDRVTDRRIDRCDVRRYAATHRDCLTDRAPHDFSIRHLILRLIKAGAWAKLVRLLHWLGWI